MLHDPGGPVQSFCCLQPFAASGRNHDIRFRPYVGTHSLHDMAMAVKQSVWIPAHLCSQRLFWPQARSSVLKLMYWAGSRFTSPRRAGSAKSGGCCLRSYHISPSSPFVFSHGYLPTDHIPHFHCCYFRDGIHDAENQKGILRLLGLPGFYRPGLSRPRLPNLGLP